MRLSKTIIAFLILSSVTFAASICRINADVTVTGQYVNGVTAGDIHVQVNNRALASFSGTPVIINGSTYLPLRSLCEEVLGMRVDWYPDGETGTAGGSGKPLIDIWTETNSVKNTESNYIDSPEYDVTGITATNFVIHIDGSEAELSSPPVIIDSRTYLPLRTICEAMQMNVDWEPNSQYGRLVHIWTVTKPEYRGSHEAPVPIGQSVICEYEDNLGDGTSLYIPYSFSVLSVYRGNDTFPGSQTMEDWLRQQYISEHNTLEGFDDYLSGLNVGEYDMFDVLCVKFRINIHAADTSVTLSTNRSDISECFTGDFVNSATDLRTRYARYDSDSCIIYDGYSNKELLSNGIYEGYIAYIVCKDDDTPRLAYKDSGYLALFDTADSGYRWDTRVDY